MSSHVPLPTPSPLPAVPLLCILQEAQGDDLPPGVPPGWCGDQGSRDGLLRVREKTHRDQNVLLFSFFVPKPTARVLYF